MTLARHAGKRSQQRGIPPLICQWLDDFGKTQYDGHGGVIRFFCRKSRRDLERQFGRGPVRRLAEYLDAYGWTQAVTAQSSRWAVGRMEKPPFSVA